MSLRFYVQKLLTINCVGFQAGENAKPSFRLSEMYHASDRDKKEEGALSFMVIFKSVQCCTQTDMIDTYTHIKCFTFYMH